MYEHGCSCEVHEMSKCLLAWDVHRCLSELDTENAVVFILTVDVLS